MLTQDMPLGAIKRRVEDADQDHVAGRIGAQIVVVMFVEHVDRARLDAMDGAGHVLDLAAPGNAVASLEMPPVLKPRLAAGAHDGVTDREAHRIPLRQQPMAGAVAPVDKKVSFFYISQLSCEHGRSFCNQGGGGSTS